MTVPGKIIFREIPTPQVEKGQVLVKVRMIGICGSDIHVYHGKHPFTSYPVTRGHEVSGEVVAFGDGVTGFEVGQKVTIAAEARGVSASSPLGFYMQKASEINDFRGFWYEC